MSKKNHIWENKEEKTKEKTISLRVSAKTAKAIEQKASQSNMNKSEFIQTACLSTKITVIQEGKNILKTLHEIKMLLQNLSQENNNTALNTTLNKLTLKLYHHLSSD